MKHTKGPWRFIPAEEPFYRGQIAMPSHPDIPDQERIGCAPGGGPWDEGEDDGNAQLIALAPTAPHDCEDPDCPGAVNKRKLELFEEMVEALKTMARIPYCHDGREHRLSCPRCSKLLKIDAAIAKAEGKGQ